jgi:hypothetical protein
MINFSSAASWAMLFFVPWCLSGEKSVLICGLAPLFDEEKAVSPVLGLFGLYIFSVLRIFMLLMWIMSVIMSITML